MAPQLQEANECIASFCRAQLHINTIDKNTEPDRKVLQERIKTSRSILVDELQKRHVSCVEINLEGSGAPVFLRLKPRVTPCKLTPEQVVHIISESTDTLPDAAEKNGYDLPKMLAALVVDSSRLNQEHDKDQKPTLSIMSSRQRGFSAETGYIGDEYINVAKDFLRDREQLSGVRKSVQEQRRPALEVQKSVEEQVKHTLIQHDPEKRSQKVQMTQADGDWVYYLQCKETVKKPNIGVRKIVALIERAASESLDDLGISRNFTPTTPLPNIFWASVIAKIEAEFRAIQAVRQTVSKVSLDKRAARR